jgi:hypothetical protein
MIMKTTTVAVIGSLAINVALALLVATVFSVTPVAHAREIAQCPEQKTAQPVAPAEHERAGGHLAAVRMGWEAS